MGSNDTRKVKLFQSSQNIGGSIPNCPQGRYGDEIGVGNRVTAKTGGIQMGGCERYKYGLAIIPACADYVNLTRKVRVRREKTLKETSICHGFWSPRSGRKFSRDKFKSVSN